MKTYFLQLVIFGLAGLVITSISHAQTNTKVRTHTGQDVTAVGTAKGVCRWTHADGASGYYVYYGPRANPKAYSLTHQLSSRSNTVEIGYLDPKVTYDCVVEAVFPNNKIRKISQILLRQADAQTTPVLGTYSAQSYRPQAQNNKVVKPMLQKQAQLPGRMAPKIGGLPGQVAGVVSHPTNVLGTTMTQNWGVARWDLGSVGVAKEIQIHYWSGPNDKHAVVIKNINDLKNARELTIKSLGNAKYWYTVKAVRNDGTVVDLRTNVPLNY